MDAGTGRRPGVLSAQQVGELLAREFSQAFHEKSDNVIEDAWHGGCRIRRKFNEKSLRPGGTISGPTMMALTDFAMYVAILASVGPVPLAVTTNLNINFLRKGVAGRDVLAAATILKLGKRLAVGEVNLLSGMSPDPIAHVTATYSIPNT